ncbi:hypothetical protein LJC55_02360 [Eubacteriales bacterium OttesenSCG-928-N14]|nr:hypothetical protein [Eubacteriales bacterium OttesenSCG-928-N14]
MAKYEIAGTSSKLVADVDARTIVITRKEPFASMTEPQTDIDINQVTDMEVKTYNMGANGMIKFVYPGVAEGGDMLIGNTTNPNMFQFKDKQRKDVFALQEELQPIMAENRARMGL